jgi:hypothetical protein
MLAEASPISVWGKHPNVICNECLTPIGNRARFRCLNCDSYDLCEDCEEKDQSHASGEHVFGKIRDSSALDGKTLARYKQKISSMHLDSPDCYTYRKSCNYGHCRENIDVSLPLIKDMLVRENQYRLSKEYLDEYSKSQEDGWKVAVTVKIQNRVVEEFMERGKAGDFFHDSESGIDFLRAAVGNFPDHMEELKECANYVRFTAFCVRGSLRVGDSIDGKEFPIYDPYSLEKEHLSDWLKQKPLLIFASSYT